MRPACSRSGLTLGRVFGVVDVRVRLAGATRRVAEGSRTRRAPAKRPCASASRGCATKPTAAPRSPRAPRRARGRLRPPARRRDRLHGRRLEPPDPARALTRCLLTLLGERRRAPSRAISAYPNPATTTPDPRAEPAAGRQHRERAARLYRVLKRRALTRDRLPLPALGELLEPRMTAVLARQAIGLVHRDRPQPAEQRGPAVGLATQQDQPRRLARVLDQRRRRRRPPAPPPAPAGRDEAGTARTHRRVQRSWWASRTPGCRARPLRACAAHHAPGTGATLRRPARAGPRRDAADDPQSATTTPDATSARARAALTTTSSPGLRLRPTTNDRT